MGGPRGFNVYVKRDCRKSGGDHDEALWIWPNALASRALGLKELDVDFEFVRVNMLAGEKRRPELPRLKQAGKVPVMGAGGLGFHELAELVMVRA